VWFDWRVACCLLLDVPLVVSANACVHGPHGLGCLLFLRHGGDWAD
jgi:hypothetical protein